MLDNMRRRYVPRLMKTLLLWANAMVYYPMPDIIRVAWGKTRYPWGNGKYPWGNGKYPWGNGKYPWGNDEVTSHCYIPRREVESYERSRASVDRIRVSLDSTYFDRKLRAPMKNWRMWLVQLILGCIRIVGCMEIKAR